MQIRPIVVAAATATLLLSGEADATILYDTPLAAPGTYFGNGNPNVGWTTDTENGVEIGLQTLLRFVGPVTPTPANSATYFVPLGTSGGVSLWDIAFSFNGGTAVTLSQITTSLSLTDIGTGHSGSFDALLIPDNDKYGPNGKNSALDSTTTQFGFQNAESLSFAPIAAGLNDPGFDPNANDTYLFTFTAKQGQTVLASVSETVVAGVGAPEPGTLSLLAVGALGLLRIRRRRTV